MLCSFWVTCPRTGSGSSMVVVSRQWLVLLKSSDNSAPAIAVTLAAASRRQFHWHSPAPPAFTGSTSIHRLHRIVMGRYIDNSSGVKMVYLQLPIYTEVQIYLSIYPVTIPRKRHCGEPPGTCHGNLLYFWLPYKSPCPR